MPTRRRIGGEQLERDFTIEPRIPRAIHVAKRAPADALEDPQGPHAAGVDGRRHRGDHLEVSDEGRCAESTGRLRGGPVHRGAVKDVRAICFQRSSLLATIHLLYQANQRPLRGFPRRFGVGLPSASASSS